MMAEEIVVKVDADLEDIIPIYLEGKAEDVARMRALLEAGDHEALRFIGHDLKGTGSGYGFDEITEIGAAIEEFAREGDSLKLGPLIARLADYLERLRVVYK